MKLNIIVAVFLIFTLFVYLSREKIDVTLSECLSSFGFAYTSEIEQDFPAPLQCMLKSFENCLDTKRFGRCLENTNEVAKKYNESLLALVSSDSPEVQEFLSKYEMNLKFCAANSVGEGFFQCGHSTEVVLMGSLLSLEELGTQIWSVPPP